MEVPRNVREAYLQLITKSAKLNKPNADWDFHRGFEVSKLACRQQPQVAMTPLMKNALLKMGDIKGDERLLVDSPMTKAERYFYRATADAIRQLYGPKKLIYDESLPLDSADHYAVDCWRNLKENMRDIQPGQAEERREGFKVFMQPAPMADITKKLDSDAVFKRAVCWVYDQLPSVSASTEFREVNQPFMKKFTNVSTPYWRNDRLKVPGSKQTYGELTMSVAQSIKSFDELWLYNFDTAYGRNQRGKGRPLIASSRIVNLVLNQLEAEEIEKYKTSCPPFAGYNDDKTLKKVLTQMLEDCNANGLKAANWDQHHYDQHVPNDLIALTCAMRQEKAIGAKAKKLAEWRAYFAMKSWLVDGMSNRIEEIHGRIFSGYLDTNLGGGLDNWTMTTDVNMTVDRDYLKKIAKLQYAMLVMGDDNLFAYDPKVFSKDAYVKGMKERFGMEVNHEKGEFGIFFLQNRLFRNKEGELVMAYPLSRVVRSMLMKETSKGLGPYGWELAFYQQLYKLIEVPEALAAVVRILIPYDKMQFGTTQTMDQILDGVRSEDAEAIEENKRAMTTAQSLYDGDPTKASQFTGDEWDETYLERIHSAICDAVKH